MLNSLKIKHQAKTSYLNFKMSQTFIILIFFKPVFSFKNVFTLNYNYSLLKQLKVKNVNNA